MRIINIRDIKNLALKTRIYIVIASYFLYAILFITSIDNIGGIIIAITIIPVIISGWLLGLRAGLILSLSTYPLNILLFVLVEYPDWSQVMTRGLVRHLMLIAIGSASGWVSQLYSKVNLQADQLKVDRERLEHLIANRIKATEILKSSEKRFRTMVESAGDVVYILDLEGNIEYINSQGSALTEYP